MHYILVALCVWHLLWWSVIIPSHLQWQSCLPWQFHILDMTQCQCVDVYISWGARIEDPFPWAKESSFAVHDWAFQQLKDGSVRRQISVEVGSSEEALPALEADAVATSCPRCGGAAAEVSSTTLCNGGSSAVLDASRSLASWPNIYIIYRYILLISLASEQLTRRLRSDLADLHADLRHSLVGCVCEGGRMRCLTEPTRSRAPCRSLSLCNPNDAGWRQIFWTAAEINI